METRISKCMKIRLDPGSFVEQVNGVFKTKGTTRHCCIKSKEPRKAWLLSGPKMPYGHKIERKRKNQIHGHIISMHLRHPQTSIPTIQVDFIKKLDVSYLPHNVFHCP